MDKTGDHWLWTGKVIAAGYGMMKISRKEVYVHRFSYELHHGPIPDGLFIDHICRVKNCVNPEHLRAVTPAVNVTENTINVTMERHRATHCVHGHPWAENLRVTANGARWCAQCSRESARRSNAKRRAKRRAS